MYVRSYSRWRCAMTATERDQRLNARLTAQEDRLLRDAAAELGKPVSRFVIEAGVEEAREILADTHVLRVADRAAAEFEAWLDEAPRELPAAKRLAEVEPFERT
ncbi:MAG: DUF1778 domain-containing protein [Nitriliruptor sp.]|nr:MAG: DUF1778 domain-containing protein [Nitriliruptor sp.]